ncbi:dephospho-CoA kinase [Brucepastera parasyntrophica]|uniref:dephospho-CoA kinase n=1 Tax=Brucepastera parasyntrophica TaxID=2880008 RepID=UPI00210D2D80|nr:dephospho-CoA kinase [Brucepastera parasyntrophica]ULQ59367.1 dephospho-CoA kinase [Brucepastera parasyntrophica]
MSDSGADKKNRPAIGLAGPMCAGKNRAAEILEKHGFTVADADIIAHEALDNVQEKIIAAFSDKAGHQGIRLVNENGKIDRRELGKIVFSDPGLLALHESIIYPEINNLLYKFIQDNSGKKIVINAPFYINPPYLKSANSSFLLTPTL